MGPSSQVRRGIAAAVIVLCVGAVAHAQAPPRDADSVKAALLLNFARFVTWPGSPTRPLVFVVVGNDQLGSSLAALASGRKVGTRSVQVKVLDRAEDAAAADVLFIDPAERHVIALLQRASSGTLTVGEHAAFLRDGGMIRVFTEGARMRFAIDRKNVEGADLHVSSQLLELSAGER